MGHAAADGQNATADGTVEMDDARGAIETVAPGGAMLDFDLTPLSQALRESEDRYRQLVQALPAAVYTTDAQGRIQLFNDAAVELWGRRPQAGRDLWCGSWKIYRPDCTPLPLDQCPMAIALREGRVVRGEEIVIERPDGTRRHVLPHPAPLFDTAGAVAGAVNMLVDITHWKRAQRELAQTRDDLAQQITALRQAKETAEAASCAKDRFLAVLSHELRTPLTPVLMTVAAMEVDENLPHGLRQDVTMIRRNVELEAKLIDDLLDLSRVVSGKLRLQIQRVDVNAAVRYVCQVCRPQILERAVRLHCELGEHVGRVMADPSRLQQVLWNVLKNAAKFTPEGGSIFIRTRRVQADARVRIEVQDTGIGIAADALPKVFDAFEQGDDGITRQFGGLGLGLAISKALVERHHGTIHAQSDGSGKGATFLIELPAAHRIPGEEDSIDPWPSGTLTLGRLRLLVVEDNVDTARALGRLLRAAGYWVKTADSVASALELAAREKFDVLVSDIGLPDATGYELVRRLREHSKLPAIAMSGFGMDDDLRKSREAGFSEHLIKPVRVSQLEEAIVRAVGGAT
jgi:PAS domain S-box-containing protein